jgi:hypothetical protein
LGVRLADTCSIPNSGRIFGDLKRPPDVWRHTDEGWAGTCAVLTPGLRYPKKDGREGQRTSRGDLTPERAEKPRFLGEAAGVCPCLTRPMAGLPVGRWEKRRERKHKSGNAARGVPGAIGETLERTESSGGDRVQRWTKHLSLEDGSGAGATP